MPNAGRKDCFRKCLYNCLMKRIIEMEFSKTTTKYFAESRNCVTFASTVPVLHTIRTAYGSFFLYSYAK